MVITFYYYILTISIETETLKFKQSTLQSIGSECFAVFIPLKKYKIILSVLPSFKDLKILRMWLHNHESYPS